MCPSKKCTFVSLAVCFKLVIVTWCYRLYRCLLLVSIFLRLMLGTCDLSLSYQFLLFFYIIIGLCVWSGLHGLYASGCCYGLTPVMLGLSSFACTFSRFLLFLRLLNFLLLLPRVFHASSQLAFNVEAIVVGVEAVLVFSLDDLFGGDIAWVVNDSVIGGFVIVWGTLTLVHFDSKRKKLGYILSFN